MEAVTSTTRSVLGFAENSGIIKTHFGVLMEALITKVSFLPAVPFAAVRRQAVLRAGDDDESDSER